MRTIWSSVSLPQSPDGCNCLPPRRSILRRAVAPAALLLACVPVWSALGVGIFSPTDPILGGKEDTASGTFQIGTVGGAGANAWPAAEAPQFTIDGVSQKYLNFGQTFTGILVTPQFNGGNGSVASSMQIWTANDAVERDPLSYIVFGTNTSLDFAATTFNISDFTQISTGGLALPAGRNGGGATPLNDANSQTVAFSNPFGYKSYLIVFPTIKNTTGSANSMQVAEVQLFGIAAFTSLTWTGSTSSIWTAAGAVQNWSASGTPSTYTDTNGVTFDDTANSTRTNITVQNGGAGVKPAAVLFQNSTLNYTIGGESITSDGSLTLNGTGSVTLNNTNQFALGTTINAGTLVVGTTGSLGTGPVNVNNINTNVGTNTNLTLTGAKSIGSLSGTIATPSAGTNTASINLSGDLTVTQTANGTFAGTIKGTGGLIKAGTGSLTLSGANTYSGPTTINAGTLVSSRPGDNAVSALPAGQPITVNSGATLMFGADDGAGYYAGRVGTITVNGGSIVGGAGTHSTLPDLSLNGATIGAVDGGNLVNSTPVNYILDGNVTTVAGANPSLITAPTILLRKDPNNTGTSTPVTFNVPRGTAAIDLDIESVVRDRGAGFIKSGAGILKLANRNPLVGPASITAGKVIIGNSDALGIGNVTISDGATLSLSPQAPVAGFSGFSLNNGATLDVPSGTITLTDNIGSEARSAFSTTPVGFASGFTSSFVYTASGDKAADGVTFTIQNSSPTAVGGGGGALGYVGIPKSAAVEFNLYTGGGQPVGTTVAFGTSGGYTSSSPVNLASGDPILVTLTYDPSGSTMGVSLVDQTTQSTYSNTFPNIDLAKSIGSNTGFVGFTGGTGGAVATQTVSNFVYGTLGQGISLSNNISIPAAATATVEMLPTAGIPLATGTFDGLLNMAANATLNVNGGAAATNSPFQLTIGFANINGATTFNVANNGTAAGTVILSGVGQGAAASLVKAGTGTLVLGDSTYTGATTVNAGTLVVNGTLSGATTTVNNSGILGGTGTLTAVTVAAGGTLAPGNSIGTINTGPLSFLNQSNFSIEVGSTTADQVKVAGAATLAGNIPLTLTLTADPAEGLTFTIIDATANLVGYAGGARFTYQGTSLAEGQQFNVTTGTVSQAFKISYVGDSGHDVTLLSVIPEPGSATSLLAGLGLLGAARRRRKQAA